MTPRERIAAALQHSQPDRIPVDLGGTESSGITAISYNRLRAYLGLPQGKTDVFDVYQQIAKIEDDLREIIRPDTVPLLIEPKKWRKSVLPDGSPCRVPRLWQPEEEPNGDQVVRDADGTVTARLPAGGYYFEPWHAPLATAEGPAVLARHADAIRSFDWPSYADESVGSIAARAEELFTTTDLAIIANLQLHLLAAGQSLRGYEEFMVDLLANKDFVHALLEMLTDAYTERCERYLSAAADFIQVVLVNDDLGTQNGPMMSLDCYREMIWPYQKRLFSFIKSRCNAFLLFHSCGSVHRFIPLLIEAGVDALNPVQVSAEGMDTARLKREYGSDITFWGGGCDTQQVLSRGTPDDVKEEVRRRVADLSHNGGFVFTQVHNIQPDVPPENVMAMYEALRGITP